METDFCGPSLPPWFGQSAQSEHGSKHSDHHSKHSEHSDKKKHKVRAKYFSQSSSSEEDQSSVPIKKSAKPQRAPDEQDQQKNNPDPVFYREVDMSDLPSQYAEEVETFRHILDLPDPRETRQNLSTINFVATFAKTASTCNTTMEQCQDSLKSTFKKVKSQIQKGANPEKAARHGYENTCDYFEILNKRILIQQRALACLSKSLAHILQRELYTMGNTGLL